MHVIFSVEFERDDYIDLWREECRKEKREKRTGNVEM